MRTFITILALTLMATNVFAQAEKATSKTAADAFERMYNRGTYDSIFLMLSPDMQKALPLTKTTEFLTGLQAQAGKITNREFSKYQQSYASYKTTFQRALFAVNISLDNDAKINGLFVKPFIPDNLPKLQRNSTKMALPFKEAWTVVWGGDTKELNHHVGVEAQKNAFDILVTNAQGKSFKTNGQTNEDYYAFGKELTAPCDGEIVLVVDGVKDNKPGELDPTYVPGNTVILKTAKAEFLHFAHFKQHSIKVKQGQTVKRGELLGLCGNSGNSSEPHLHFHIQNVESMNIGTGAKCYFDKLMVNGQAKTDYSPVKGDIIKSE